MDAPLSSSACDRLLDILESGDDDVDHPAISSAVANFRVGNLKDFIIDLLYAIPGLGTRYAETEITFLVSHSIF